MRRKYYTFFVAAHDSGKMRRVRVPHYVVHIVGLLALVGCVTVLAGVSSYSRMVWKVAEFNSLRRDQDSLKQQYRKLQTEVKDTDQRLNSLQSLAGDVAAAYGLVRVPETPFSLTSTPADSEATYQKALYQFNFLEQNSNAIMLASEGVHLLPGMKLANAPFVPSLWPVLGRITSRFGERLDPFGGEGEFHTGLDIASHFGDEVRAAADGVVTWVGPREGYGNVVIIDHGFGITTWYAHLSGFNTQVGMPVRRGDVIAYEGESGRATGPHLHFEVRMHNAPVNPWRYLHQVASEGLVASGD